MTRILIVDDHDLILDGLISKLGSVSSDIVSARSFDAAIETLDGAPFDICILDLSLKPGSGDQLLLAIRQKMPSTKAICISGDFSPGVLAQLKKSGFDGFYSKADDREEIVAAVESLDSRGIFYSSSLQLLMDEMADIPQLSKRQRELLQELAEGKSNSDAAADMGVTPATVSFHMKHLKRKLNASNARDIVNRAKELGLI